MHRHVEMNLLIIIHNQPPAEGSLEPTVDLQDDRARGLSQDVGSGADVGASAVQRDLGELQGVLRRNDSVGT